MSWDVVSGSGVLRIGLIVLTALSCGKVVDEKSRLLVSNGEIIADSEFPAVGLIYNEIGKGFCTGTFINPKVMITAAHCIASGKMINTTTGEVDLTVFLVDMYDKELKKTSKLAKSYKVFRHPLWDMEALNHKVNRYDLGVVFFQDISMPNRAIGSRRAQQGDRFVIVGYGLDYVPQNRRNIDFVSFGYKRLGTNSVGSVANGMIQFYGQQKTTDADGTNVSSSMGDSGGPMFIDDSLVGVTSGGRLNASHQAVSAYVDLHSSTSKVFLDQFNITY